MGISFLFFIREIGLAEDFFRTTAEALVLTRAEFKSLDALATKGFFDPAQVKTWVKQGKIRAGAKREAPKRAVTSEDQAQATIDAYRQLDAKLLITEDDFLRAKLRQAGLKAFSTPDIVGHMAKKGVITKERAIEALEALKVFGWHNKAVLSQIQEVIRHG